MLGVTEVTVFECQERDLCGNKQGEMLTGSYGLPLVMCFSPSPQSKKVQGNS